MALSLYVAKDGLGHKWEKRLLVPMKAQRCSVGDCQGKETGVGVCVWEHPHRSRRRGGVQSAWGSGKGITFKM